ncbi:MAG TPA: hypothetical protein VF366_02410 [Dehalococcoidia bacterium]|jgi:uncharacterized protein YoxC
MDIGWYRDLVICISGLIVMVVVIFIAILAFLLFRKVRPILDNVQATTATVREVTYTVKEELVKPVLQFSTLIRGITQGIELVSRLFKKEEHEGGCNG